MRPVDVMSDMWLDLIAAFGLGLAGAGHCFGMCGGVVAALSFAVPAEARVPRWQLNLGYNLGRIASYSLMGALVAALAARLPTGGLPLARTLAGLLLIAMGLYLANWWRGLLWLERGGQWLWRRIKPLGDRCLPLDSLAKALGAGMVWGWLPCGLVYAALGFALTHGDWIRGALVMAAFGLGTLPALLLGGALAGKVKAGLAHTHVRLLFATAYMLFGIWTIAGVWYHQLAHHDNRHEHAQPQNPADPSRHQHHH